jgi:hypothetical protein
MSLLATHPAQAAALAGWGWPHDRPSPTRLAELTPRLPATITLTGESIDVHLSSVTVRGGDPSDLYVDLVRDGSPASYDLGTLPRQGGTVDFHQTILCQQGCRWQGFTVVRALTDSAGQYGRIDVDSVTVGADATPVDIGPAPNWHGSTPVGTAEQVRDLTTGLSAPPVTDPDTLPPNTLLVVQARAGTGFTMRFFDTGAKVSALHGDVPYAIPALTTKPTTDSTPTRSFDAGRLDGAPQLFTRVGTVAVMPGVPGNAALADIDIVARLGDRPVSSTTYQVWLADPAPRNITRVTAALTRLGVPVYGVRTIDSRETSLARTGPALSLQLGLISGAIGLLVGLGVLLITTVTTLRSRRYDVAALELSGVSRRVTRASLVGEGLALSVVGTVVGTACGVAGGRLLLRAAPFLTGGASFAAHRTFTAWWLVASVLVGTCALLVSVAALIGSAVVRSAPPAVVRQES